MICEHKNNILIYIYNKISIFKCQTCGLVFNDNYWNKKVSSEIYENYYKNETGARFNFNIERIIMLFRFFRAFKIYTIYPKGREILDIGSGRGFMIYYLKKYFGYTRATGIQISQNAVDFSRKKLGLEIHDKDFLQVFFNNDSFDIITIWHVLEHLSEPEKYIQKMYSTLKLNGMLIIEVPNYNSWTRALTGKYWLGLDLNYHLTYFSKKVICSLLEKYKFEIKKVNTFSLEYSTFISAQSIVSRITKTDHLIFRYLQNSKFSMNLFFHFFLFILIFPLCFIINVILYFTQKGEVLLVVAEKNH